MANQVFTKMKLSGIPMPLRADDEISVTLRQVEQAGELARTVNGELIRLSRSAFDRYAVSISGSGINAPPLSQLVAGQYVEISTPDPVYAYLNTTLSRAVFPRAVVDVEFFRIDGSKIRPTQPVNYETTMTETFSATRVAAMRASVSSSYLAYQGVHAARGRLVLACRVVSWSIDNDDRSKDVSWNLELEEV